MPITIRPYNDDDIEAVRQFNGRIRAGGLLTQFPLSPVPAWLPKIPGRRLFQEHFLAVERDGVVRGGYVLKHQDFWLKNRMVSLADFQLPISEGVINKSYPQVAVQLLRHAMLEQPLLFGLGMGGYDQAVTRLLQAAGWSMFSVPFFFRVRRPAAFLENLTHLRRNREVRWALDALRVTGLGWLGVHGMQAIHGRGGRLDAAIGIEQTDEFSGWIDDLWEKQKGKYGLTAVRDCEVMRILYPKEEARFIRLKITRQSRPIGGAVLLDSRLANHNHFGNMRLGTIVSCFGATEEAPHIVHAARSALELRDVDLIVSNHSHAAWRRGFRQAGFLQGPSNFIFAASKELTLLLAREGLRPEDLHFNRGDGDGPINL
jgi:hypothetical protein